MLKRVCVIGAGAGGLCAGRHLSAHPQHFTYDIFERSEHVAGTWVYTSRTGTDDYGQPIHSSMYKHLHTNLPKEVMAFPDFAFDKSLPSFIHHTEVRKYLEDYARHYKLADNIKFHHSVECVKPLSKDGNDDGLSGDSTQWEVTVKNLKNGEASSSIYDAVFVCSGHYAVPKVPEIPGLSAFTGHVIHSHEYRDCATDERFTPDSVVVCLGAGSSGQDIALELSRYVSKVYLCHSRATPIQCPLPRNLHQLCSTGISRAGPPLVLTTGEEVPCDALVLCTGYHQRYPMLHALCGVTVDDGRVTPLYKHLVNIRHPHMFLIGILLEVAPFPVFDVQARFCVQILLGSHRLPSAEDMLQDTAQDYAHRTGPLGMPHRRAHRMGELQWAYGTDLCSLAGLRPLEPVVRALYEHVHGTRRRDLLNYKRHNYRLISHNQFEVIQ